MMRTSAWSIVSALIASIALVVAVLVVWLVASFFRPGSTREEVAATCERASAIIIALDQYHADHKDFPPVLRDLVPKYLPTLEPPLTVRKEWEYRRYSVDRFVLDFFVGPDYQHEWYDTAKNGWSVDY